MYIEILFLHGEFLREFSRFFFHCPVSTSICLMIVSKEMKKPVNQQFFQFFIKCLIIFPGLLFCFMKVHNDVPEKIILPLSALPGVCDGSLGKREAVRCVIDPPVRTVEFPHCTVVYKEDAQFRTFKPEMTESCRQKLFYSRETYFSTSLLIPYVNFHL